MKAIITILIGLFFSGVAFSQDDALPDYLSQTKQQSAIQTLESMTLKCYNGQGYVQPTRQPELNAYNNPSVYGDIMGAKQVTSKTLELPDRRPSSNPALDSKVLINTYTLSPSPQNKLATTYPQPSNTIIVTPKEKPAPIAVSPNSCYVYTPVVTKGSVTGSDVYGTPHTNRSGGGDGTNPGGHGNANGFVNPNNSGKVQSKK